MQHRRTFLPLLFLTLSLTVLSACSAMPKQPDAAIKPFARSSALPARWQIFCIHMPYETETKWHLDTLLIDRILAPELYREKDNIALWRFHRRSGNDSAGHRLRFLVYAEESALQRIAGALQQSPLLEQLIRAKLVKNLDAECGSGPESIDVAATSDPNWSPELQHAWPYFAMGVSAALLDLIESERRKFPEQERSVEELLTMYEQIHKNISRVWLKEGQHGFLHHLNALFGYQPIWLQQNSWF
ncbi:MAG: hypothetical protein JW943_14915 [Deltaproteobacteria bacterium]|nr:hypothetical protein [Deltaproteobacteria bacterium]